MNRRTFYPGQVVLAAEVNDAFDQVELGQAQHQTDNGIVGVQTGLVVTENTVPDLSVLIGTGRAYDSQGRRIANGSTVNLDVSVDSNNTSTAVVTPGNEKWISIFAVYALVLSDLRPALGGLNVYWREDESVAWVVVQGSEAAIGIATRPALISGYVLVGDFVLVEGQTAIVNANIDPDPEFDVPTDTRKQFVYSLTSSAPAKIVTGSLPVAMQQILTELNNHVTGVANQHDASVILFDTTDTNFTAADPAIEDVEAALNECGVLSAPHPGNLWSTVNRLRTHGANEDWRDEATLRTWTFAAEGEVPGGGGNVDFKLGSWDPGDFELGYIEIDQTGHYTIELDIRVLTPPNTNDPAFEHRHLVYKGTVQRNLTSVTLLTPVQNTQVGGADIALSIIAPASTTFYVRAACGVALEGLAIRMTATAHVQFTPTTEA